MLLVGLGSCVKHEDPPVNNGSPLFSMKGTVDGAPFTFEGGVNDYYMFTQTKQLEFGLNSMVGKLAKQNCPETCGPSLKIYFRNYTLANTFNADSLFQKGQYVFYNSYNAQHWTYELRIHQRSTGDGAAQFGWDFGSNRFSSDAEPTVIFSEEGIYPITGSSVYSSCFSQLVQQIYLTPTRVGKHTDFSVNHIDTFELLFNSIPIDNNALVSWDFGDGNKTTGSIVKHRYTTGGMYKVTMQYVKGNDTMLYSQNVKTLDIQKCMANYQFTTSREIDSLQFKTVVIEWTDANGVVYSSANTTQDNSLFEIHSITPFQVNANNQQTKLLNLSFNCNLSNGSKVVQLNNVTGTFGIAIPTF
jgi:hypothetical protein